MLVKLFVCVSVAIILYRLIERGLGVLLTRIAKSNSLHVEVKGIGFGIAQGVHIRLPKGPVADVRVKAISLGRAQGARELCDGLSRAADTSQWRLPLMVQGLHLQLRAGSQGSRSSSEEHKPKRHGRLNPHSLLTRSAARVVLGILPFVPLRVKDVTVALEGCGLVLELQNAELLLSSRHLFSQLAASLDVAPLSIAVLSPTGDGSTSGNAQASPHRVPVLDVEGTQVGVELHFQGAGIGVRCLSLDCSVASIKANLSKPLLQALATLKGASSSRKRAHKPPSKTRPRQSIESFVANLPAKVKVQLGVVVVGALGPDPGPNLPPLEASAELRQLLLICNQPGIEEQQTSGLYTAALTAGPVKVGAGPAACVSTSGLGVDVRLLLQSAQDAPSATKLVMGGKVEALETSISPESLFAALAGLKGAKPVGDEGAGDSDGSADPPEHELLPKRSASPAEKTEEGSTLRRRYVYTHERPQGPDQPCEEPSRAAAAEAARPAAPAGGNAEEEASTSGRQEGAAWAHGLELRVQLSAESRLVVLDGGGAVLVAGRFSEASISTRSPDGDEAGGCLQLSVRGGRMTAGGGREGAASWELARIDELVVGTKAAENAVSGEDSGLRLFGVVSLTGAAVSLDQGQLSVLGALAQALVPPASLKKSRGTPSSRPQPRTKPARLAFTGASVHVVQLSVGYSTAVDVPESFRTSAYAGPQPACAQFSISGIGADVSLTERSVLAAVSDVQLSFTEGQRPAMKALHLENFNCNARSAQATAESDKQTSLALALSGLQGSFEADSVFIACQAAVDFNGVLSSLRQPQPEDVKLDSGGLAHLKPQKARTVLCLEASLEDVEVEARLSDDVCWAAGFQQATASLPSQSGSISGLSFSLNQTELARVLNVLLSVHLKGKPGSWPARADLQPPSKAPASVSSAADLLSPRTPTSADQPEAAGSGVTSPVTRQPSLVNRHSATLSQESLPSVVTADMEAEITSTSTTTAGRGPVQPFQGGGVALGAAYTRAGLSKWATAAATEESLGSWQPPPPAATLECCLQGIVVTLPFTQDPGTAQRYSELWAKAFKEALRQKLEPLQQAERSGKKAGKSASGAPLEVRLTASRLLFKMEHHPMEAWLAVRGPQLAEAASHNRLWGRALDVVSSASPRVNLGGSQATSPTSRAEAESQRQRQQAERQLAVAEQAARAYVAKVAQASTKQEMGTSDGALMHVGVDSVEALLVVCAGGNADSAARRHIVGVDAASEGVPMRQVCLLFLDVAVGKSAVYFSGNRQPLASLRGVTVSGSLATGRQITAPPVTQTRQLAVGTSHSVPVPVAHKGARALIKVYSDLKAAMDEPRVCFSIGLEPTIGLLAQAGKRLTPTDPDKSRPKPPTLPWFDMLRFVWRGRLELTARNFDFTLGASDQPNVQSSSERLQASAQSLGLTWRPQRLSLSLQAVSMLGFLSKGIEGPAGALHALPLLSFPRLELGVDNDWLLPGGRSPLEHHLHPVPPVEGEQQQIDVVGVYKSTGVNLKLDASCTGRPGEGLSPGDSSIAAPPAAYAGGHQIAFMKLLIQRLQCPPLWSKLVARRGTFYQPMDPKRPPVLGIPKLIKRLEVRFSAWQLDVVHHTVDPEDPSCGLVLSASEFVFSTRVQLNIPAPRPALPGYTPFSQKREKLRVASVMQQLEVEAAGLKLTLGDEAEFERGRPGPSRRRASRYQDLNGSGRGTRSLPWASPGGEPSSVLQQSTEALLLSFGRIHVQESRNNPTAATAEARPMHVVVEDCRIHVDAEGKEAIWGAVSHVVGALSLPRKFRPFEPHMLDGKDESSAPTTPGQPRSFKQLAVRPQEDLGAAPELLTLLLQQREPAEEGAREAGVTSDSHSGDSDTADDADDADGRDDTLKEQLRGSNFGGQHGWKAEEQAWAGAERRWEVELHGLQICMQPVKPELNSYWLVLLAEKAKLSGLRLESPRLDQIALDVDQVRGMVAQSVDPAASSAALSLHETANAGEAGQPPPALREVFQPFSLKLRNTKAATQGDPQDGLVIAGEETRLLVPYINVNLDSREFHVMMDVINNVGMSETREVATVNKDLLLLGSAESHEVAAMRETYDSLRCNLNSLMEETLVVQTALQPARKYGHRRSRAWSGFSPHQLGVEQEEAPDASLALADYASQLSQPEGQGSGEISLSPTVGQQLLLRWGQEQIEGARQALHSTARLLRELKKAAQKHQKARHASRFLLEIDGVSWALCQERRSFLEVAVSTAQLDSIRHLDRSGSSKLLVQRMEVTDTTGVIKATQSTPAGAVLVPWNPDTSWERDALLCVNAVLGVPTRTHTVYEHLDVMVHPLGVHLIEPVATRFWEYFFPKEEEKQKKGEEKQKKGEEKQKKGEEKQKKAEEKQKKGSKSGEGKGRHSRRASVASNPPASTVSSDSECGPAPPPSVFAGTPGPLPSGVAGPSSGAVTSTHTSPGLPATTSAFMNAAHHRRVQSVDSARPLESRGLSDGAVEGLEGDALQASVLDDLLRQQSGAVQESVRQLRHSTSLSLDEKNWSQADAPSGKQSRKSRRRKRNRQEQMEPAVRRVLFKHVRVNRFHCRVTYQGYPISFSDFRLVLDKRVYRQLDGRWRDLFQRLKWDTIKSVVKSVAGLQGRKFKELLPSWDRDEKGDSDKKGAVAATKSWIANLGKKKQSDGDEGPSDTASLKEKAKSRLLLGNQHLSRSGHSSGSGLPTVHSGQPVEDFSADLPVTEQSASSSTVTSPGKPPSGMKPTWTCSGALPEQSSPQRRSLEAGQGSRESDAASPAEGAESSTEADRSMGLSLSELLASQPGEDEQEEAGLGQLQPGWDMLQPKQPAPTAKTKAARLFGKAGNMLREAGTSVSQATTAVAQQAQSAAAKAERWGANQEGLKRGFGGLLNRQKRPSSAQATFTSPTRAASGESPEPAASLRAETDAKAGHGRSKSSQAAPQDAAPLIDLEADSPKARREGDGRPEYGFADSQPPRESRPSNDGNPFASPAAASGPRRDGNPFAAPSRAR